MTRPRVVTVQLTEAQFRALAGAVAESMQTMLEMADDAESEGGGYFGRQAQVLDRAFDKISRAWHAQGRA